MKKKRGYLKCKLVIWLLNPCEIISNVYCCQLVNTEMCGFYLHAKLLVAGEVLRQKHSILSVGIPPKINPNKH